MFRPSPIWLLLFFLVWWVLAEPRPGVWLAAAVAVAAGGVLHGVLGGGDPARHRVRPMGLLHFVPYFLWQSVKGGADVTRRALAPSLPLDPDLLEYRISLPPGAPRVFFTGALSLLPGTFSARVAEDRLTVHLLTAEGAEARIRELEERVARLFAGP